MNIALRAGMHTLLTEGLSDRLRIDASASVDDIASTLRQQLSRLRRSGLVVAMSGGIDSAVCAALAVEAVGARHVLGLALPEQESDSDSLDLAQRWAAQLGVDFIIDDITPILSGARCYDRRDSAIARVTPYGPGWKSKLVVEDGVDGTLPLTLIETRSPDGAAQRVRLPAREFREIVAATNFKQRVRAMVTYHCADRRRYAVCGTPNRLEYELGFFVKGGDGLADVKPIAHLYKSQVYQLAEHLGVTEEIRMRPPTTDTYSLPQSQEEFFFALPLRELDLVLQALNDGLSADEAASELGLPVDQVRHAYQVIENRRRTAEYLHSPPLLVQPAG